MNSAIELKLANDAALKCAGILKSLLIPAAFYAESGFVCSRSGTDGDTADRLADDIAKARVFLKSIRSCISACSDALTVANKSLTPIASRAGLNIGGDYFCHAHEAVVATLSSVASHLKSFSEDPAEARFVDDETIDVAMLRDNLSDAFESLSHDSCFLSIDDVDALVRDVRQEYAIACHNIPAVPAAQIFQQAAQFDDTAAPEDEKRNGKWSLARRIILQDPKWRTWTTNDKKSKLSQWNELYAGNDGWVSMTLEDLSQRIRDLKREEKKIANQTRD